MKQFITPFVQASGLGENTLFARDWAEWVYWSLAALEANEANKGYAAFWFSSDRFKSEEQLRLDPLPAPSLPYVEPPIAEPLFMTAPDPVAQGDQAVLTTELYRIGGVLGALSELPYTSFADPTAAFCSSTSYPELNGLLHLIEAETRSDPFAERRESLDDVMFRVFERAPSFQEVTEHASEFQKFLIEQCWLAAEKSEYAREFLRRSGGAIHWPDRHGRSTYIPLLILPYTWGGLSDKVEISIPPGATAHDFLQNIRQYSQYLELLDQVFPAGAIDELMILSLDRAADRTTTSIQDSVIFWRDAFNELASASEVNAFRSQVWSDFAASIDPYRFFFEEKVLFDLSLPLQAFESYPESVPLNSSAAMATVQTFQINQQRGETAVRKAVIEYINGTIVEDLNFANASNMTDEERQVISRNFGESLVLQEVDTDVLISDVLCVARELHVIPPKMRKSLAQAGIEAAIWENAHTTFFTDVFTVKWQAVPVRGCTPQVREDELDSFADALRETRRFTYQTSESKSVLPQLEFDASQRVSRAAAEIHALFTTAEPSYMEFVQAFERMENILDRLRLEEMEEVRMLQGQVTTKAQSLRKIQNLTLNDAIRADSILQPKELFTVGNVFRAEAPTVLLVHDLGLMTFSLEHETSDMLPPVGFAVPSVKDTSGTRCLGVWLGLRAECPIVQVVRSDPEGLQVVASVGDMVVHQLLDEYAKLPKGGEPWDHVLFDSRAINGEFASRVKDIVTKLRQLYDGDHIIELTFVDSRFDT